MNYEYTAPETDSESKLTTFHHSLDMNFDQTTLEEISTKLTQIRSNIIKA